MVEHPRDPRRAALGVLGLNADASLTEIKQAHRRLVKQHHPDLGGSAERFDVSMRLISRWFSDALVV